jgi:endonuclease V-like protein UPF0215 family
MSDPLYTVRDHLERIEEKLDKAVDDHEQRIRILERWKYALPASVITGLVSGIIVISNIH